MNDDTIERMAKAGYEAFMADLEPQMRKVSAKQRAISGWEHQSEARKERWRLIMRAAAALTVTT